MKKFWSKILVLIMFTMLLPVEFAFGETKKENLEVLNAAYPSYELQKNDTFKFGMSIKNNSEYEMRDVTIKVSNSSFITINEDATRIYDKLEKDQTMHIDPFTMFYNGGSESRLFVKISYRFGAEELIRQKVVYFNMQVKEGEDGKPSRPELYKPHVVMQNTEQPTVENNKVSNIAIRFKNDSKFEAVKVKVTGMFAESNFELTEITPIKYISSLMGNEEYDVVFQVRGKKGVASGVYPITLNIEYENVYGEKYKDNLVAYIKYIGNEIDTNVELTQLGENTVAASGEAFNLELEVKNLSETEIKDVSVELLDLDSGNIINKNTNFKKLGAIKTEKTKSVIFEMISNDDTQTGNYKIKAKVSYKDETGKVKEFQKYFYKKIEKHNSELFIGGLASDKHIVKSGESFTITVPVYNYGKKDAENIRVSVMGDSGVMNTTSNVVLEKVIEAGEKKEFKFTFKTTPKISEGNKNLTIKVSDGKTEKTASISVYAEAEVEETNTSIPKVIISKYQPNPVMVKAGKNFELKLALLNTHRDKTVRNLKITLTTTESSQKTGSVFSPVNSSNTYFIDEIMPKSESEMNITMFTIPDAQSKTYTINVSMEYEDEKGKQYSAHDIIGVPVRQQSKFMTTGLNVPEQCELTRPIRMDIEINNNGKIELANFTVRVEGDFVTDMSTKYIGGIQPGNREYYDVDLTPTKEGLNKGVFIFSYEEPSGEVIESRTEFSSTAVKPYVPEYNEGNRGENGNIGLPEPPVKKGFPWVKVILGVGAVALIVVIIVVTKKEKKKKEMELDE